MTTRLGRTAAACVLTLAALAGMADAAEPLAAKDLEVQQLADGVYAAIWKDALADPIEGNALFIINDEDVVVVDSSLFPSSARRMIAELRKLTAKPVRYVINTHWHDDHHMGNFVYRETWPEAEFVSHVATRANILEHTYAPLPETLGEYGQGIERYTRWAATGLDDEGQPLVERRRKRAGELVSLLSAVVAELGSVREMPPDLTFSDRLLLRRGARTIEVRWLGRGNTAGDVVVFLPEERIVASGDLLVSPIPFCFGSYYAEWIETLAALDVLPADVIVPGHGPAMRNRDYLHTVQGLLRAIEGRGRAFDAYVLAPAIERAYRQAKGEDPPEGRA